MNELKELLDLLIDFTSVKDANLQHIKYFFEGYRSYARNYENPYSEGSARAISWSSGYRFAAQDASTKNEPFYE